MYPDSTARWNGRTHLWVQVGPCGSASLSCNFNSSSYLNIRVFVKLVSGRYPQAIQRHLAAHGLSPKLYGTVKVDGAPTAYIMEHLDHPYIMEYLDPSAWQTLHQFLMSNAAALGHSPLEKTLQNIVARLEDEKYVHGDLRTDNIMIRKDSPRESPDLTVVDFDWAGERNQVRYPADRNTNMKWPGKAGGLIQGWSWLGIGVILVVPWGQWKGKDRW